MFSMQCDKDADDFCESLLVVFVTDRDISALMKIISVSVKNFQRFEPSLIVLRCSRGTEYAYTSMPGSSPTRTTPQ